MTISTNPIPQVKRPPVTGHLIDLTQHGLKKARSAQFHPLGTFLAVVPLEGEGKLFKTYDLYGGTEPELKPVALPQTTAWQSVAFNPQQNEPGEPTVRPELAVACGDEIVQFVQKNTLQGWTVLRRMTLLGASCVAYSQDGQLIVAGSKTGRMKVWVNCGDSVEEIQDGQVADSCITSITVSDTCDVVYFSTANGDCFRFSGGDGAPSSLKAPDEQAYGLPPNWEAASLACSPKEPHIVLGGCGDMAWFYNVADDHITPLHTALGSFIRKVCYLHKHRFALLGERGVELWESARMKRTNNFLLAPDQRALAVRCFINSCYIVVS